MIDSVIAGTGNSRYLRTSLAADTTWEDALTMLRAGTFPIDLAGINAAGFTTVGTALTSATLLKAAVCTALGLNADATPSDAWEAIISLINTKADADDVVTGLTYNSGTKTLAATINGEGITVATFDFVNAAEAATFAPVQSVAGKTGDVTLTASDVGALPDTTPIVFEPGTGNNSVVHINSTDPNTASGNNALSVGEGSSASGNVSVAIGNHVTASGLNSIALGFRVSGYDGAKATGAGTIAIGASVEASNSYALAAGYRTVSSGVASAAFGDSTVASGNRSFSACSNTVAKGARSAAFGRNTVASGSNSFVVGKYNVPDETNGTANDNYAVIIGNGTADNARSNALTVDWDGNEVISGDLTVKAGSADEVNVGDAVLAAFPTDTVSGAVANFPDGAALPVKSLSVAIEPVQNLNGYGNPWPAGGGKNLLPKGENRASAGITFSVQDNGEVVVTGTAERTTFWAVQFTIPAGSYILSGCPSGGGASTYYIDVRNAQGGAGISGIAADAGSGSAFTISESLTAYVNIRIASGYAAPSGGLKISPMIRLSSVSDATYAP